MVCTASAALLIFHFGLVFGFGFFLGLLEKPEQLLPDLQPRFPVPALMKQMEGLLSCFLTLYHFPSLLSSDIAHLSSTFCDYIFSP